MFFVSEGGPDGSWILGVDIFGLGCASANWLVTERPALIYGRSSVYLCDASGPKACFWCSIHLQMYPLPNLPPSFQDDIAMALSAYSARCIESMKPANG